MNSDRLNYVPPSAIEEHILSPYWIFKSYSFSSARTNIAIVKYEWKLRVPKLNRHFQSSQPFLNGPANTPPSIVPPNLRIVPEAGPRSTNLSD
ncbi:hypothetical protein AVEN_100088-1 [Araneus ventricosus]|uniref:Uncharacterized protein n=1 Tax=Araneus ventricosus TaxID=182803 RepID=A0A4Y2J421_ARAVE|nr:hypothetical protein AVEN_100088-1 [Araneus ventricosus]